jgi:hypothetical protein
LKIRQIITFIFLVALLVSSAKAAVVGASPSILRFNNMLKSGYSEISVTASTSITQPVKARLSKEGDIAEWITFSPEKSDFVFSMDNPYTFNVIMQPPEDAANGNYTGVLKITTEELATVERGAGSAVIAQVALLIYVEISGEEFVACRAGAISISNTEIGSPFFFRSTVYNDGNVRLRPKIQIDVYDQYQTQIVYTTSFFGNQILPTKSSSVSREIENELPLGQYFAKIYLDDCNIIRLTTFDVLERGQISDSGEMIGIRSNDVVNINEPMAIEPIFRNNGERKVFATFKGEIKNLRNGRIEQILESEELEVNPGETINWRLFYTPNTPGTYQISGRVIYNNKITFEEQSKVITAKGSSSNLTWLLLIMLYLIIGIVILILIGKIKKAKKKKRY